MAGGVSAGSDGARAKGGAAAGVGRAGAPWVPPALDPVEVRRLGRVGAENDARMAESARQEEIFEAQKGALLARHPGKSITVCAGEVFVADSDNESIMMAEAAHPDWPTYARSNDFSFFNLKAGQ